MMHRWIPLLIATTVTLALPRPARAEIAVADSLAWMAADADLVVRGTVASVKRVKDKRGAEWQLATISASEVIKGKRPRVIELAMRPYHRNSPEIWRTERVELLLFLVDSARRAKDDEGHRLAPFALRRGAGVEAAALRLTGKRTDPAYTIGFDHLTKRDEILAATRIAVRSHGRVRGVVHVEVPFDAPAARALYGGSAVWLNVPIDHRLLVLGLRWRTSPDLDRRVEAVRALSHFRSAANIGKLRHLLQDPGEATRIESGNRRTRIYPVRQIAYDTLRAWGVKLSPPVLSVPIP